MLKLGIGNEMHAGLLLLTFPLLLSGASAQTPTYSAAGASDSPSINTLRHELGTGHAAAAVRSFWNSVHKSGAPLIETDAGSSDFSLVTFVWQGNGQTRNVVIFDGVAGFDGKDQMLHLDGSDVWYKTYRVRNDARFAYNISPNDSLQPFDQVKGDEAMRIRLAMLKVDPLNPHRCPTTFGAYGADASYVELPGAPPPVWNLAVEEARKGKVTEAAIHSENLAAEKKLWIYTPAGFTRDGGRYPLLVLFDGDRNVMWLPRILDVLIAQGRIPPVVAVMTDESVPSERRSELPCNPQFADFLADELVPWARRTYFAAEQPERVIVAGSSFGGLASVFAGVRHPEVFGNAISLSGSFWWKPEGAKEGEWLTSFVSTTAKVRLQFYLEVGLMESYPVQVESNRRMRDALISKGYPVGYSEYDGGHSFLNWSGGMVNGLERFFQPAVAKEAGSHD
jgi:enterochelin esterase-like enzyme